MGKRFISLNHLNRGKGKFVIVYRDETGKHWYSVKDPSISFFVSRKPDRFPKSFVKQTEVEEVTVPYNNLFSEIASITGKENELSQAGRNPYNHRFLHGSLNVHGTDVNIEDKLIADFLDENEDNYEYHDLHKVFYDIEVDSIEIEGFPEPEDALCPVNLIQLFDPKSMRVFVFILRNEENPLIQEFENNFKSHQKELLEYFREKTKLAELKAIKFAFFDDEIDVITSFFDVLHTISPDYAAAWNCAFDLETLQNRIINLGYDPEEIMCDPELPFRKVYLSIDKKCVEYSESRSYYEISSKINFTDSMINYAKIRKGSGKKDSYALDAIAIEELGEDAGKEDIEGDMKRFPYLNFFQFVKYGIQDVIILHQLEVQNKDIDLLHSFVEITRTRIHKVLTKTISLRNVVQKYLHDTGYELSNNKNADYSPYRKNKEKFAGAYVLETSKMNNVGTNLLTKRSNLVFDSIVDFDLSSMYPSIMLCYNIEQSVQIGKITFNKQLLPKKFANKDEEEFCEDYVERDLVNFASKWFGFPDYNEVINLLSEEG